MLRKKEERLKKQMEEKEKRRVEREKKKAEKLELEKKRKEAAAMKGKGKGKRRRLVQSDESSSDGEGEQVHVVYDDRSDDVELEELYGLDVDESVCAVCGSDMDQDGWIGCECGRWFHRGCTGEQKDRILGMSEEELSMFHFVCRICA